MREGAEPTWVLDASAVLAFVQDEPGGNAVEAVLGRSLISTVNWAEVAQKSLVRGVEIVGLRQDLQASGLRLAPFTMDQADIAAQLWSQTRQLGLSLGDRACLALGLSSNLPVLTADRAWQQLSLPIEVRIMR